MATPTGIVRKVSHHCTAQDFRQTMGVVAGVHLLFAAAWMLWPGTDVEEIPVRTLNIKLGSDLSGASRPNPVTGQVPLPPLETVELADMSVKTNVSQKKDVTPPPQKAADGGTFRSFNAFVKDKQQQKKQSAQKSVKVTSESSRIPAKTDIANVKLPAPPKAVSSAPKQYVRASAPAAKPTVAPGNPAGQVDSEEIMLRYEQKISAWLQKYKTYPPMARQLGQHGTPVVRIRIERDGNVVFSSVDQSSGYQMIDKAALEMVKKANPLPAAPSDYPGGGLLEFKIPVQFKLN